MGASREPILLEDWKHGRRRGIMQQTYQPDKLAIVCMLDRMHKAKRVHHSLLLDEARRQEADTTFANCYDWLIEHDVPFQYDTHLGLWLFCGIPVTYW